MLDFCFKKNYTHKNRDFFNKTCIWCFIFIPVEHVCNQMCILFHNLCISCEMVALCLISYYYLLQFIFLVNTPCHDGCQVLSVEQECGCNVTCNIVICSVVSTIVFQGNKYTYCSLRCWVYLTNRGCVRKAVEVIQ